ncbi:hypothetical protein QTP88_015528 [Uroleucon formosanum]
MNLKIGRENICRHTIGKENVHSMFNEKGAHLIRVVMSNGIIISSTYFKRKDIYKQTWTFLDAVTKNQIDHVMLDNKHRSWVSNFRSYKGANANTDHYLVVATLTEKFSILWKENKNRNKDILTDYQTGFRRRKSTTDHIFTIRQVMKKIYEYNKEYHILFIDFKQAYDSIDSEQLWTILRNFVNEKKTIYMVMSRQVTPKSNLKVYGYSFEQVKKFKYLGLNINEKKHTIKISFMMANKSYYVMKEMFMWN